MSDLSLRIIEQRDRVIRLKRLNACPSIVEIEEQILNDMVLEKVQSQIRCGTKVIPVHGGV